MADLEQMITGYRLYKNGRYQENKEIYTHRMQLGEKPHTLVITSCSLPVGVETITGANAGDLYVVRNMGGIVPSFESSACSGTAAAVAYALDVLRVSNVIVLNHKNCDGINVMMDDNYVSAKKNDDHMAPWLDVMKDVRGAVNKAMEGKSAEDREDVCTHEVIIASMRFLLQYPVVQRRVKEKPGLNIYGMHFDLEQGELEVFNPKSGNFEIVV